MVTRTYWVATIAGDGIGREVIPAATGVLKALITGQRDFTLLFDELSWGAEYYWKSDCFMPADGLLNLRQYDAIYFGAFGDPRIPDHVVRWGWWLPVCRAMNHYVSIQPIRLLPGVVGPLQDSAAGNIDWVIVRDNGEEERTSGAGLVRRATGGLEDPSFVRAFDIMRLALEVARSRPRQSITVAVGTAGFKLWGRAIAATRYEFPEVTIETEPLDTITSRMVQRPGSLDTIIATGSHADILENLGTALARGHRLLPRVDLDPARRFPAMFRPAHGPAFDIAGKGTANPIAAIWSGALMLDHLGEKDAAAQLLAAIEQVTAAGASLTPDLGGTATTRDVADAAVRALRKVPE